MILKIQFCDIDKQDVRWFNETAHDPDDVISKTGNVSMATPTQEGPRFTKAITMT